MNFDYDSTNISKNRSTLPKNIKKNGEKQAWFLKRLYSERKIRHGNFYARRFKYSYYGIKKQDLLSY